MSNTDTQKPSEHAMSAAKKLYPYGTSTHMVSDIEELEAGVRRDQEAKAHHIDTHAIKPAVEEAVREHKAQIAELVRDIGISLARLDEARAHLELGVTDETYYKLSLARMVLAKHERSAT